MWWDEDLSLVIYCLPTYPLDSLWAHHFVWFCSLVALPVRDPDSGEVTMVAEMVNKASGVFGEEDLALLRAFTKFW
mgnify:CR=1 FL=1